MLFMKGSPDEPRCGFSRKIVELLRAHSVSFGSFDILQDEEVRAGLKVLFDWPTYPQVYVHGELVGGLDILTEMATGGALREEMGLGTVDLPVPSAQSLNDRLAALVRTAPIMLFMKGSPDAPRCGFSRSVVEILNSEDIPFSHFDILQDEEVRAGLKTFSDWPTYPQIYHNGELVGGLDILKEMQEAGPLKDQLMN
jgi:Grx4 family monothiol glutaredoxin